MAVKGLGGGRKGVYIWVPFVIFLLLCCVRFKTRIFAHDAAHLRQVKSVPLSILGVPVSSGCHRLLFVDSSKATVNTSSQNRLPSMILSPPRANCREMGFLSCGRVHFPADKCTFLQQNAFLVQKIVVFGRRVAGNRRRVSGLKNQER